MLSTKLLIVQNVRYDLVIIDEKLMLYPSIFHDILQPDGLHVDTNNGKLFRHVTAILYLTDSVEVDGVWLGLASSRADFEIQIACILRQYLRTKSCKPGFPFLNAKSASSTACRHYLLFHLRHGSRFRVGICSLPLFVRQPFENISLLICSCCD